MNSVKSIPKKKMNKFEAGMMERGEKYYILFLVGIKTGLRVSDILSLRAHDFYSREITEQKTKKRRQFKIDSDTRIIIEQYIERNRIQLHQYLIPSGRSNNHNKHMSRRMAHYAIRAVAKQINVPDLGTHSLRKTFAVEYIRAGHSLTELQKELNHEYLSTTMIYLADCLKVV